MADTQATSVTQQIERLAREEAALAGVVSDDALREHFPLGVGSGTAAMRRRRDARIDRTISASVRLVALRRELAMLRQRAERMARGECDALGRILPAWELARELELIAGIDNALASGRLKGRKIADDERVQLTDLRRDTSRRVATLRRRTDRSSPPSR